MDTLDPFQLKLGDTFSSFFIFPTPGLQIDIILEHLSKTKHRKVLPELVKAMKHQQCMPIHYDDVKSLRNDAIFY